jgi:predicted RNase H-like HicB family nuclease
MDYPALIDGAEGAYGVVFPDLPGCVAMGSTLDEVVRNAEDAMRDWIASMEANGQKVPEPSPVSSVTVPEGNTLTTISPVGVSAA